MAASRPKLTVLISPDARSELKGIHVYNARHRSQAEADSYEDFLLDGIARLATTYGDGRSIDGFPELKGLTLKRSRKGDGHIVVYEVDEAKGVVNIHHIFHTKMNVRQRLDDERL